MIYRACTCLCLARVAVSIFLARVVGHVQCDTAACCVRGPRLGPLTSLSDGVSALHGHAASSAHDINESYCPNQHWYWRLFFFQWSLDIDFKFRAVKAFRFLFLWNVWPVYSGTENPAEDDDRFKVAVGSNGSSYVVCVCVCVCVGVGVGVGVCARACVCFRTCVPSHLPVYMFILAGGHVRASAGALAVHTALIPCVCVRVCVCVCVSGIKLLFHHATNRYQVCFCRQVSTR